MMWKNNEFDQLLQEAIRCDRSLRNTRKGDVDDHHHIVRVFTRLMFSGKVHAAVRWLSEKGRGSVLQPFDLIETKTFQGNMSKLFVWEILIRNIQTLDSLPGQSYTAVMTCLALRRLISIVVVILCMWLIRCKEGLVLEVVMLFIGWTRSFNMVLIVRDLVSQ